jgi:hypothetical protein
MNNPDLSKDRSYKTQGEERSLGRTLKTLLALALLGGVIFYLFSRFPTLEKGTDFPHFYVAARMVRAGHGHEIYNFAAQQTFQARYAGRIGNYYLHPLFEALLYLPLTYFSIVQAYLFWSLLNAIFLIFTAKLTSRHFIPELDWQLLLAALLLFPPVLLNFLQGQDSGLLFFIFVAALVLLQRGKIFLTGLVLGCGLFKFHLVLLVALVITLLKGRRFLAGFVIVASVFTGISAAIGGWGSFTEYFRFVRESSDQSLGGVHPLQMANLRGLTALILPPGKTAVFILAVLSLLAVVSVLWVAIRLRRRRRDAPVIQLYALAMIAALLTGYSLSPHDLAILLLPMAILWQNLKQDQEMPMYWRFAGFSLLAILFFPPLHILLLSRHLYALAVIPILILFVAIALRMQTAFAVAEP